MKPNRPADTYTRRQFTKRLVFGCAAVSACVMTPFKSFAAWSSNAFQAIPFEIALERYFGTTKIEKSSKITIKMAKIAQNGSQVPITVSTSIPDATSITLLARDNPIPLIASFSIFPGTLPNFSTRIRLAKSTEVFAVVKTETQLFKTSKKVNVTVGGCGG